MKTQEYSVAIRIDRNELFTPENEVLRADKTKLTNQDAMFGLCQAILRQYVYSSSLSRNGWIKIVVKRYLPFLKNMIEYEFNNQQAFEEYLQGVASDQDPDARFVQFEIKYLIYNPKGANATTASTMGGGAKGDTESQGSSMTR